MHSALRPVGLAGSIPWFAALAGLLAAASPSMTQGVDIPVEPSTGRARRVLIVTGEDYAGHLWRETAPALAAALAEDPRLSVETLDDLTKLAGTPLGDYDAVVLHFKNYDRSVPGREAFDNLRGYVEGGGGLVLTHFACGAFREFRDEFVAVVGRVWFGDVPPPGRQQHDPLGEFSVQVLQLDHPATMGVASFTVTDELYTCLEGDAPVVPLAVATSKVDGKTYPIAFAYSAGEAGSPRDLSRGVPEGRVFQCVLGHDARVYANPGAAALLRRGVAWAAGL